MVGEQLQANSVRVSLEQDCGFGPCDVCTFFHGEKELQRAGDQSGISEAALEERIRSGEYQVIVGDTLLRDLDVPESPRLFIELPHVAVSSRLGWMSEVCPFGEELPRRVREARKERRE